MNITPHITLDNLIYHPTAVRLSIPNIPPDDVLPNLIRLCSEVLEPVHALLDGKMAFVSGYRSDRLQAAMVRQGRKSIHTQGLGADFQTPGMDLSEAFDRIMASDIPFDTLSLTYNRLGTNWINVTIAKQGDTPRRETVRGKREPERVCLA